MKMKCIPVLFLLFFLFNGCIQDEPLSPYADIEEFSLPEDIAASKASFNQTNISVYVKKGADLTTVVPQIKISEGSTITPSPDIPQDFSQPVRYTVTAQDGSHQREYTVQAISVVIYSYNFENWEALDPKAPYETPVEYDKEGRRTTPWDSSNRGIHIYMKPGTPGEDYPIHKIERGSGKYAAELSTIKGPGDIFGIMNIPIAAGSLFIGELNPLNALKDPLLATQFGQPFYDMPIRMTGKYMYKPGTGDYIDPNGNVLPNVKDSCSIYSIFYRTDETLDRLDGTNVFTHPNIVAMAMLSPNERAGSAGDDLVPFDIGFEYKTNHVVDFEKNEYKLAIVFSSSFYGDRYEGVIGSRLIVDDVEILIDE